jgi:hypothetical protein
LELLKDQLEVNKLKAEIRKLDSERKKNTLERWAKAAAGIGLLYYAYRYAEIVFPKEAAEKNEKSANALGSNFLVGYNNWVRDGEPYIGKPKKFEDENLLGKIKYYLYYPIKDSLPADYSSEEFEQFKKAVADYSANSERYVTMESINTLSQNHKFNPDQTYALRRHIFLTLGGGENQDLPGLLAKIQERRTSAQTQNTQQQIEVLTKQQQQLVRQQERSAKIGAEVSEQVTGKIIGDLSRSAQQGVSGSPISLTPSSVIGTGARSRPSAVDNRGLDTHIKPIE